MRCPRSGCGGCLCWNHEEGVGRDLLQAHLQSLLDDTMEDIRRYAYRTGWRDAKSKKKPKRGWFASATYVLDWEKKEGGRS
jgi:hypothetical protein